MKPITETVVQHVIRPRDPQTHKGDYGRVLIIGGNAQFGGAAIMSASAAVYAGAGLVSVATAGVNRSALHARLPEAMIIATDDDNGLPALEQAIQAADVIVIGPGLGTDAQAKALLSTTLAAVSESQTLLIDGSAITLFATGDWPIPSAQLVWTPHQMEWQRLSGIAVNAQNADSNQAAAAKIRGTVVVKGHRTQVFSPTAAYENTIGGSELATGGSGDTLTGILAAFIAQFGYRDDAIIAGVYAHSAIAEDIAATNYVALPSMVIKMLPHYMAKMATD